MRLRVKGYIELAKNSIALRKTKDYMAKANLFLERVRIHKLIDIQVEFKKLENREKESMKEIAPIPIFDDKHVEIVSYLSELKMEHFNMNYIRDLGFSRRW